MKKHELLEIHRSRRRANQTRQRYEAAIIEFLPSDLDIERVHSGKTHLEPRANCHGLVDIRVDTYDNVLALLRRPCFEPAPLRKIVMKRPEQAYLPTVTFYPSVLVPPSWRANHGVASVYPALFQIMPEAGKGKNGTGRPIVFIEWFVVVEKGIVANIRAFVKNHPCKYVPESFSERNGNKWTWRVEGLPNGPYRAAAMTTGGPPHVTVYWHYCTEHSLARFTESVDWLGDILRKAVGHVRHS